MGITGAGNMQGFIGQFYLIKVGVHAAPKAGAPGFIQSVNGAVFIFSHSLKLAATSGP